MLTVEQCRTYLKDLPLTDKQVEELRDALYSITSSILLPHFYGDDDQDTGTGAAD